VVAATKGFVTIRVRVPEAYLLLQRYETGRPALLILDADGRRVDAIPLPGMGAADIEASELAKRLRAARQSPATEYLRASLKGRVHCMAKVRRDLLLLPGVRSVVLDKDVITLKADVGSVPPGRLLKIAGGHIVTATMQEPVAVNFMAQPPKAIADVAGVWYVEGTRAYVTRLLLDPKTLAQAGDRPIPDADIEARTFLLTGLPKGGAACRVALAPMKVAGVLTIFADVFHDRQVVVGRKGEVSWPAVVEAFGAAGCKARREPDGG